MKYSKNRPSIHPLFIRSLNVPEHLNVTTFLGGGIRSSFVAGRVAASVFFLVFGLEFAEAGYHDVLCRFEGSLDEFNVE